MTRAQCIDDNVTLDLPITITATDLSAFSHTVNVIGATYVNGQDGGSNGALSFAGQGHGATIPADPAFESMSDGFTISAWVYPTSFQPYNAVVSKLNGSHRNINLRYHSDGKLHIHFTNAANGISSVTTDSAVVSLNEWQHLVATWDGSEMRLYVNGELKKESTLTQSPTFQAAGSVRIGTLNFGSERVVGYIDNVQMRAYPTASDEIKCLESPTTAPVHGIVLEMPLDGDATDQSNNYNDGTNNGAVAGDDRWTEASSSMVFGSGDRIFFPHINQYDNLAFEFTISAWIKPTAVSGTHVILSKTTGGARNIVLRIDAGKLTAHFYDGSYHWCTPVAATVVANEWSHIACTWDGTTMSIYHNGEILKSVDFVSGPQFSSGVYWTVGSLTTSGGEHFAGSIDDLKIWDRTLTICELRSDIHANLNLIHHGDLVLCDGELATITTQGEFCSYNWVNDGSSDNSFDVNTVDFPIGDHQIVLEAYDSYDHFYSDTVDLTVAALPAPDLGNDTTICTTQTITLDPGTFSYYDWSNFSSGSTITVDNISSSVGTHQFWVEVGDNNSCFGSDTVYVTIDVCTGIDETSKTNIMKLYPNPTTRVVTVSAENLLEIQLHDVSGRVLEAIPVENGSTTDLDISKFPAGVYFISGTKNDGTVLTERLIKH